MTKPNTLFKEAYNSCLGMLSMDASLPSETELSARLKVSRTTVRSVLTAMVDAGLLHWEKTSKQVIRLPVAADYFPDSETDSISSVIERAFMARILSGRMTMGDRISEADLARDIGVSTSAVREFLIRFSRFGIIEKQRNRHWVLKGFTEEFALELFEVREMFEIRSTHAFIRLPAQHPAWTALERIEAEHRALLEAIDTRYRDFSELDERFHRLIHNASQNRFILEFYEIISMIFHYHYQWNKAGEKERNRVAIEEHLRYVEGLRSRSLIDAEYLCRKHLISARQTLLTSLEQPTPSSEVRKRLRPALIA
ncbi:GntR family transcriptional regulator [Kaistia dalseonensis]|uniref:DNA-binding GntR family transcriptional regulator n=1 Tax=Kaistia dalseonensis TaxID=410840 RepID=A0ABU0HAP4_9HYPH|nr:GntR family transcriptional regulator [Kaistia dalseonensis]MCX5496764.1 GntR family transcriptional regulator [Kaistia dalseonensis]MDQ0439389.1 DNA-binding GntR family transcriptional regulator [Kaistia dalseonensis]